MKTSKKTRAATAAAGLFLLSKFKFVFVILKVLKIQTLISMALYLGTYAFLYGWKFAVALVYLIFVHEMGHTFAAKRLKLSVSPAIFIPFVGAAVAMKEMPKSAKDEAYLAYMGPVFGFLSFLPAIPLYVYTNESFWAFVIFLGGLLNLINLIPMTPLDGGRIVAGISPKLWIVGLILLLGYSVYFMNILGFLVTVMGSIQWYNIYKRQKNLINEQQELEMYASIYEDLREHAKHASVGNFEYFASSFKRKINNAQLIDIFELLNQIENDENAEEYDRQIISQFLKAFDEFVQKLNAEYVQTASYYKTNNQTKLKLFVIYLALALVLGLSVYYGNSIIMDSEEMKMIMERS